METDADVPTTEQEEEWLTGHFHFYKMFDLFEGFICDQCTVTEHAERKEKTFYFMWRFILFFFQLKNNRFMYRFNNN